MLDFILTLISAIFMLLGIIGCVLPIIPGPPISYAGLILLQMTSRHPFSFKFFVIYGILTASVTVLDYIIPLYSVKKFKGSRYALWGSTIGLLLGLFFIPPFGIILLPISGAFLGEMIYSKKYNIAVKSAFASFIGFAASTSLKLVLSCLIAYHFLMKVLFP
ncbi:membrane protein containing DUF456 [Candidatus Magnetoovum chiemensis]|nr:membrane protein containing DUF456 [Candidatus Magnetoovum chiemensis]